MIGPIIRVALRAIRGNPLRAGLTMLGVIIGVGAVVAMVALGAGARAAVAARVQNLGSNLLLVVPSSVNVGGVQQGLGAAQNLMWDDALAIKDEVPQVEEVAAEFSRTAQVVYAGANMATSVVGVTTAYPDVRNHHVVQGAFFTDEDMQSQARVAVLGPNVVKDLFGSAEADPIGARIKINRSTYTVIGVLEVKSASGSSTSRDDVVLVPMTTAQKRLYGVTYVRQIDLKVRTSEELNDAEKAMTEVLRARHRIPPKGENDFRVYNQADVLSAQLGVSQTMTMLLGGIAAVSLLVGGIGIMNIMLVSVTERTREIGLRKAVGATQADVLLQFLVEAVLLSVSGGVLGILVGAVGAQLLSRTLGWATIMSVQAALLAFVFSVAVGVFFGYYPARRAASLHPIEALRYE